MGFKSTVTVVVGGFFGDEGKGNIVCALALRQNAKYIVKGGEALTAGHVVQLRDRTYKVLHLPSGFHLPNTTLLVGPGVIVDPVALEREVNDTDVKSRFGIDGQCPIADEEVATELQHVVEHITTADSMDTTAPQVSINHIVNAVSALHIRRKCKVARDDERLTEYIRDVPGALHEAIQSGERIIVEGSHGTFSSIIHGTYPFCCSKDTTAASLCSDVGLGPKHVRDVVLVFKCFVTRSGEGPLEGELSNAEIQERNWTELVSESERPMRIAPFDFGLACRAAMLNSATKIALTRIDVLFPDDKNKTEYELINDDCKQFLHRVESEVGVKVAMVQTGPKVEHVIFIP